MYLTEKIDFKKKIVSIVTIKNLIKQEIRKNKEIHVSSNLEKTSRSKNWVQEMSKQSLTSKNILDKYENWKNFFWEELNANALFKYQS